MYQSSSNCFPACLRKSCKGKKGGTWYQYFKRNPPPSIYSWLDWCRRGKGMFHIYLGAGGGRLSGYRFFWHAWSIFKAWRDSNIQTDPHMLNIEYVCVHTQTHTICSVIAAPTHRIRGGQAQRGVFFGGGQVIINRVPQVSCPASPPPPRSCDWLCPSSLVGFQTPAPRGR